MPSSRALVRRKPKTRRNKAKKKPMSKSRRIFMGIFTICLMTFSIVSIYVLSFCIHYINGESKISLETYKQNQDQTTIIYATDRNNQTVELTRLHGEQNRVWVSYSKNKEETVIPNHLADAYVAFEDKRFYKHHGVDWFRTLSSAVKYRFKQGGSTITQQLIKNLTGENGETFNRKFYEILSARNLERYSSKDQILEAYMNTVYMSHGCYGVQTAAEKYFGKNVQELNIAESACLASITQFPTRYDPLINPENNRERQLRCLEAMHNQHKITDEEYNEAINYKMIFTNSPEYSGTGKVLASESKKKGGGEVNSYYVDYVIDSVIKDLMKTYSYSKTQATEKIYSGGLRIYTAVDLDIQSIVDDVYVNRKNIPRPTKALPDFQSAMTVMDYSGRVVAMAGGADQKKVSRGINRAVDSYRQPGSSMKPLAVYAPAINEGKITYSTAITNYGVKGYLKNGGYGPVNYGNDPGNPNSKVTVQHALARSLNTVPAQIIRNYLSINKSFEYATEKFHLNALTEDDKNMSSLAVGGTAGGVSTLQMAAAYASFGNGGIYYEPYCYYKVTDASGEKVLLQHSETAYEQVISAETADIMNRLLQTTATDPQGTMRGNKLNNMPIFAKTGTTTDDKDSWVVAGTPYYISAVWVGCDTPKNITSIVRGSPAGKIFTTVMNEVDKGLERKQFASYSSKVVERRYCTSTGCLAGNGCPVAIGYFNSDSLPKVCSGSHAPATPSSPPAATITQTPNGNVTTVQKTEPPKKTEPTKKTGETKKTGGAG